MLALILPRFCRIGGAYAGAYGGAWPELYVMSCGDEL